MAAPAPGAKYVPKLTLPLQIVCKSWEMETFANEALRLSFRQCLGVLAWVDFWGFQEYTLVRKGDMLGL